MRVVRSNMAFTNIFLHYSPKHRKASSVALVRKASTGFVWSSRWLSSHGRSLRRVSPCSLANAKRACRALQITSTLTPPFPVGAGPRDGAGAASQNNGAPAPTSVPKTDHMSRRAQALRAFLRSHKSLLRCGDGFHTEAANTCRKNDTALMFVPIEEIESYRGRRSFQGADVAAVITTNAEAIIEAGIAAARVNKECYEGKNLATLSRTEAIEEQLANDMRDQLRIVSYAVLAQEENAPPVDFLHRRNVALLLELYHELGLDLSRVKDGWQAMARKIQELCPDPSWYEKRVKPAVEQLLGAFGN